MHKNGTDYTDNQMKSEILNEQFSSVFKDDGSELPHMGNSPYQDIPFIEFDVSGITNLLNDLDPTKSSGPDQAVTLNLYSWTQPLMLTSIASFFPRLWNKYLEML